MQGGELVGTLFEGISLQVEAAAQATSLDDLFERLDATGQLLRVDESVTPTMYKAATVSAGELEQLRRIDGVVRLGTVRRIERDAIVLDEGTIPTSPRHLHVHCAARGLNPAPAVPSSRPIASRCSRSERGSSHSTPRSSASSRRRATTSREKNRLCPPNRLPDVPLDWVRGTLIGMNADYPWSKEPDSATGSSAPGSIHLVACDARRTSRGCSRRGSGFADNVRPGLAKLMQFLAQAEP